MTFTNMNPLHRNLFAILLMFANFGPFAYYRLQRTFQPKSFEKLGFIRRRLIKNFHHGHAGFFGGFGLLITMVFFRSESLVIRQGLAILAALCCGFVADEIFAYFASTKGASRHNELDEYDKSVWKAGKLVFVTSCCFFWLGALRPV